MLEMLIGAQWGDEGKGKWIDIFGENSDIVARFQGGNNAGHTLVLDDKTIILHQIPSGILRSGTISAILSGVVIDPVGLLDEIASISEYVDVSNQIFWISERAHVITPFHIWMDGCNEDKTLNPIGTTKRGIGPAYMDKASRLGLTAVDLLDPDRIESWVQSRCKESSVFSQFYLKNKDKWEEFFEASLQVARFVCDAEARIRANLKNGSSDRILMEGAQGTLLDMNHGTYPYVTSSNPTSGGAVASLGVDPRKVGKIYGIAKAYTTRVGEGPFPTECFDQYGKILRTNGREFGATTGRPRRCGWYDAVAMRYACEVNGFDFILLNKLDVLSGLDELRICVGYEHSQYGRLENFPSLSSTLENCKPVYRYLGGWREDIKGCTDYSDLPEAAKKYIDEIVEFTGVPVKYVGTGPGRSDFLDPKSGMH